MCNKCPLCQCANQYYGRHQNPVETPQHIESKTAHELFRRLEKTIKDGFLKTHEAIEALHEKLDE